jgi:hypothetical protein
MHAFFESLERRDHFSAAQAVPAPLAAASGAIIQPAAAKLKSVLGAWSGTLSIPGIHDRPVTINITKQSSSGVLGGKLTTSLDPSIVVAFSGRIKSNGAMTITLVGGHSGGAINGTGTGKLASAGSTISFKLIFTQGGQGFPGTISLKKGAASTPPPTSGGTRTGSSGGEIEDDVETKGGGKRDD